MNKTLSFGIATAAVLALAACDSREDGRTAGQKLDEAIAEAKVAGSEAKENAQRGLEKAADATREKSAEVAQKTETMAERAGEKVEGAAERAGAAAERAGDRAQEATRDATQETREKAGEASRTVSRKADDASITAAVKADLAKDPDLSALRIDVDTRDGKVSLSGTAPSEAAKQRAATIAQGAEGVSTVENRLTVASR